MYIVYNNKSTVHLETTHRTSKLVARVRISYVHAHTLGKGAPPTNSCCSWRRTLKSGWNSNYIWVIQRQWFESSDQNTKQESQDSVVETLANKVLLHMHQKLQTQKGGAHVSGSSSSSSISSNANKEFWVWGWNIIHSVYWFLYWTQSKLHHERAGTSRIKYTQHAAE